VTTLTPPESEHVSLDSGRLLVARQFLPVLRAHNLDVFEKIMAYSAGTVVRTVPGRTTARVELPSSSDRPLTAYLKRYEPAYLSPRRLLLRLLRCAEGADEAMREWRMMHVLRSHGFNAAPPIAVGQQVQFGLVTRSFVMTAEITGGVPADQFLKGLDRPRRREFLGQLAELTHRFQRAGFIHKDYYLNHIFVVARDERTELFLIDLQRVLGPGRFRARWFLKDISGLAYSAQRAGMRRTELLWLYKRCFDRQRLDARDKRHIRQIIARVARIQRHRPRYGEPVSD
jgi:hypothetical protein